MAFFAGFVLLVLASSDAVLGQRKHNRNLQPVGADVKTGLHFDCPEEFGYYPHPADCTQYYVCVFGGALLESCTGGLMYSHELQTCDWPRNVGCDGPADVVTTPAVTYSSSSSRTPSEAKVRYTHPPPPPPPPQPAAIVTSRGQPRQLHHNQQELIKQKQQQQLYEDAEDALPPAEEIESDRQQRVYRGQPSTVGQVQRDRDGLRHHTNAIPSSSGRGEKIGVISFGTQSLQQYNRDLTDDNDLLTNSLTTKHPKRYKRQIQRSHDRGIQIDSWHVITNPYAKLQRPMSFHPPAMLGNTYKSHSIQNNQHFQPITLAPLNYNRGHAVNKNLENSKSFLTRNMNNDNYRYFNFQTNTVPPLSGMKTAISNYSKYPYDGINFNSNNARVPSYEHNSNYFIPPNTHFVLGTEKYNISPYSESSLNLQTTPLHRESTTENNFSIIKQRGNFYNPIFTKGKNELDSYRSQNYYNIYKYVPVKNDIKQVEHNASAKFKNAKETVPSYNLQIFDNENIKQSSTNTNTLKHIPENNITKLYPKIVKNQSELQDSTIQNTTKANISLPELTNLKHNLTQLNTTHTDDVYYYYYDDEGDGTKSKETNSTQSSISNHQTPSRIFSENKYYYDDYYDYRDANTTDYYYDDFVNVPPKKHLNNSNTPTQMPIQHSTYSKIPTQPSTTTLKSPKIQEITGKLTTTMPTITARLTTNTWSMSTTRPTTEKVRQRLISTTHWYINNDKSTNQHNITNSRGESRGSRPVEHSHSTVAPKVVYNTSNSYDSSRYDPYYALYDDDVDLYKDVEYSQHYNNDPPTSQQTYRGTPASSHQVYTQEKTPKRGNAAYIQNSYSTPQDIYQSSIVQNYDENHYSAQDDDRNAYHQTSKQTSRGDRNELNYIEESATTKRITTSTTTTTTMTTPRQIPTQKSTRAPARLPNSANANEVRAQPTHYTLPEGPGYFHANLMPNNTGIAPNIHEPFVYLLDNVSDISLQKPIVSQPAPFTFPQHLTTPKTSSFHYITKMSKSTSTVSTIPNSSYINSKSRNDHYDKVPNNGNSKIIIPTTYAPASFFLKSLINTKLSMSNTTLLSDNLKQNNDSVGSYSNTRIRKHPNAIKTLKLRVNPSTINNQLWSATNDTINDNLEIKDPYDNVSDVFPSNPAFYDKQISSTELFSENDASNIESFNENDSSSIEFFNENNSPSTESFNRNRKSKYIATTTKTNNRPVNHVTVSSSSYTPESFSLDVDLTNTSWLLLLERLNQMSDNTSLSRVKVSEDAISEPVIPKPLMDILHYETTLLSLEKQNSYMSNPIEDVTKRVLNASRITSLPTRVSRVNAAIKSVIALGGPQRQYTKCNDNQTPTVKCKKINQRVNSRGRGSAHYSSGPGDAVVVNRGTPPARSRPTLKPSTSIVSKAQEFIDIYKYPPHRPPPIYPQPQPDKTAAKCRKDVCLLPDCSCGGKEIPGDLDVLEVPQMVLLTFDDAVNDLNLPYYAELFENDRVNPNGCPIVSTFYVSHEWTDYSQVQNLYADGHEMASHTVSHSFGEQFSQKKWTKEVAGQREILSAYGGVRLEDVRGMRAPFLSVGGNKMFKMLYDSNFTYDSSMPIYENKPPSWPYTLDYKLFHDCMIPPCPTRSYPGVWEVPMVMWQDLNGGRCSMGDACSNPSDPDGVYKMLMKNFERHYTTNRAPFGLFYHAAWFTQPHHKAGFIQFLDAINSMKDVWLLTNWQAIQWVRDPTPVSRLNSFQPFGCNYPERPKRCNNPKVCNLWHKTGVRYMRTCQPCPEIYPWTGNTGIRSSRIDNELED